jgi:hypothetical protein
MDPERECVCELALDPVFAGEEPAEAATKSASEHLVLHTHHLAVDNMSTFPPSHLHSSIVTFALVVPCINTEEARYFVRSLTPQIVVSSAHSLHSTSVVLPRLSSFFFLIPIPIHSHLPIRSTFLGDSLRNTCSTTFGFTDKYE